MTDAPAPVACVEVAVPVPLPGPLTYSTPAELVPHLRPGQRVRVPVGRRVVGTAEVRDDGSLLARVLLVKRH